MEDVVPYAAKPHFQTVSRRIRFVKHGVRYSCLVELAIDVDALAFQLGTRLAMSGRRNKSRIMHGAIKFAVHSVSQEQT